MTLTPNHAVISALAILAAVVLAARLSQHRRSRAPRPDVAGEYLDAVGPGRTPHATALPSWVTALVVLAAVFGAVAAGVALTQPSTTRASNNTSQAQQNRSTCLSTLNANWRLAWSIEGVALDTPRDELIEADVAARLRIPRQRVDVISEAQARLVASAADDLRIGSHSRPICPFVAGDPTRTSEQPVDSATAKLEAKLRRTGHP